MKKELVLSLRRTFEEHAKKANGVEFWYARDLLVLLGYVKWENFDLVVALQHLLHPY